MTDLDPGGGELVLAVDLGGTKLETALVDAAGRVLPGSRQRRPTGRDRGPDEVSTLLADASAESLSRATGEVVGAGVGAAGPLDAAEGTVSPLNMALLARYPVREVVEVATGLPTTLRLDGTCIALAEHWLGATRGTCTSMSLVVSTGVGGGVIADGRLLSGRSGNAGHVGQTHVPGDAGPGVAGTTLEAMASGPASVLWARSHGWHGRSGEDLAASVRRGDPVAEAATRRSARCVGVAVASAAALLDVEAVAIGGGFSRVRPDYVQIVEASVHEHAVLPRTRSVRVVASPLRGEGPLLGAAALRHRSDLLGETPLQLQRAP